jgi:hypothetical protein
MQKNAQTWPRCTLLALLAALALLPLPLLSQTATPTANHVFLPRHRIMVQVQSSWFPLYDRNPQTFVPNIFWAKPVDFQKASQRIYHAPGHASFIELPVVTTPRPGEVASNGKEVL